jgi:hypothetical protein
MGCDIHGYVEVRIDESFNWDFVMRDPDREDTRWYALFGELFGVRIPDNFVVNPKFADRGLPDKLSDDVKEYYNFWKEDAHSESWVSWQELKSYLESTHDGDYQHGAWYSEWYAVLFDCMEIHAKQYGAENVRWVVWFDN